MTANAGRQAFRRATFFLASIAALPLIELAPANALGQQFVLSPLKDISPGASSSWPRDMVRVGDEIFFAAEDPAHGNELWASDGTAAGTRLVDDIYLGTELATRKIWWNSRGARSLKLATPHRTGNCGA